MKSNHNKTISPELRDKLSKIKRLALDMDGTIYLGSTLFPFTIDFLDSMKNAGVGYSFLTNNPTKSVADYLKKLEGMGIQAFGPYPADGFFGSGNYRHFDGVLAMYHDQGLAPFKTLAQDDGVNYTAGLPIGRTSPDHGTAYDIAGKGVASEQSFRNAIYTAIDVYRNRINYDEPFEHPLPKLYHEKKDESEKVRFATPKAKREPKEK